jgi:hypothetical protein
VDNSDEAPLSKQGRCDGARRMLGDIYNRFVTEPRISVAGDSTVRGNPANLGIDKNPWSANQPIRRALTASIISLSAGSTIARASSGRAVGVCTSNAMSGRLVRAIGMAPAARMRSTIGASNGTTALDSAGTPAQHFGRGGELDRIGPGRL